MSLGLDLLGLTYRELWPFGFCLAFVSQLSWWGLVLYTIPTKAWGKELRVSLWWRKPRY